MAKELPGAPKHRPTPGCTIGRPRGSIEPGIRFIELAHARRRDEAREVGEVVAWKSAASAGYGARIRARGGDQYTTDRKRRIKAIIVFSNPDEYKFFHHDDILRDSTLDIEIDLQNIFE